MDLEQIKFLDDGQKDRYMKLQRVFESDGWALIEQQMRNAAAAATDRILNAQTWDQSNLNRGARFVYNEVATLRETTDIEFAQLAAAQAATQEVQNEIEFE
jgi:hypothetical protein